MQRTNDNLFISPLLLITPQLLDEVMAYVIEANSLFVEDLNRKQLGQGIRADGTPIGPYYTKNTVNIKKEKGQPFDRVRLKDTGSFYEKIFVEVFAQSFMTESADPKSEELQQKYGNIFGLTPENKLILAEHIKPQFVDILKVRIGL